MSFEPFEDLSGIVKSEKFTRHDTTHSSVFYRIVGPLSMPYDESHVFRFLLSSSCFTSGGFLMISFGLNAMCVCVLNFSVFSFLPVFFSPFFRSLFLVCGCVFLGHQLQNLETPWWVLPAEVLHGLTFAAMWSASSSYATSIAPGKHVFGIYPLRRTFIYAHIAHTRHTELYFISTT